LAKISLKAILSAYSALAPLNQNFQDIQEALDRCLFRDGEAPNEMLDDLDMNHFRIRNLGAPVGDNDAVRLQDIRSMSSNDALYTLVIAALATKANAVESLGDMDALDIEPEAVTVVTDFDGGIFKAATVQEVLDESSLLLRFLPRIYSADLNLTGPGANGETVTIGGHTITIVTSGATGQQVNLGADAKALSTNLARYIGINSPAVGVRAHGFSGATMTPLEVYANVPGPAGALAVSEASTSLSWATSTLVDKAIGTSMVFDDHTITWRASGATGQEVNIGATPAESATNLMTYINANSGTLGLSAEIHPDHDSDLIIRPLTAAGITRIRKFAKGATGCPMFHIQERNGVAADKLSALYRLSSGNADIVNVRQGWQQTKELHNSFWGIRGNGEDVGDIRAKLQELSEASEYLGCTMRLAPGTYDITTALTADQNMIFFYNQPVIGWGATIESRSDYLGTGAINGRNAAAAIGHGHPAHDAFIANFTIEAGTRGDNTVVFQTASDADWFREGDLVPISTVSGRLSAPNWHPAARDIHRFVEKDPDDATGATWLIDPPLYSNFPAGSRAGLFMGYFNNPTKHDIYIASNQMEGLSLHSELSGAMYQSQAVLVDWNLRTLSGHYGLYVNALTGKVRVEHIYCHERPIELAHNTSQVDIEVNRVEWWPNTLSDDVPLIKEGENCRNWHIKINELTAGEAFEGIPIILVVDGRNGTLELGNSNIADMTAGTFFRIQNSATQAGEHDSDFRDLTLKLGQVRYGGVPNSLVDIWNVTGGVHRINIEGGHFDGDTPADEGMFLAADECVVSGIRMPGKLVVHGNDNYVRGRFDDGYDADASQTASLQAIALGSGNDIEISSRASASARFMKTSSNPINTTTATTTYASVAIPASEFDHGNTFIVELQYATNADAATKHIDLFFDDGGGPAAVKSITVAGGASTNAKLLLEVTRISNTQFSVLPITDGTPAARTTVGSVDFTQPITFSLRLYTSAGTGNITPNALRMYLKQPGVASA
jgi:hypothetical protein